MCYKANADGPAPCMSRKTTTRKKAGNRRADAAGRRDIFCSVYDSPCNLYPRLVFVSSASLPPPQIKIYMHMDGAAREGTRFLSLDSVML